MARCLAALLAALAAASAAAQAGSGEWLQMPGARPKDAAESSPPVTPAAAHVLAVAVPPAPPCSRERSKLAAEITRAHVLAAAEAAGVALPEACPLHPSRAYFAKQDESRVKQGSKQWRCGACRKRFRSELYLEQHFDRRHASLVPPNAVCLADFCEILHCPPAAEAPGSPPRPCSDAEMEKQRLRCQLLFDKCFPSHEGPASLKLHDAMVTLFCEPLHCERERPELHPSEDKRSGSARIWQVLLVFALVMIATYYVGLWLWRRETLVGRDRSRLSELHARPWWKFWQRPKKKAF